MELEKKSKVKTKVNRATFPQQNYPVGLDIGTANIKAIQLTRTPAGKLKIIKLATEPLPEDIQDQDKDKKRFLLEKTLKKLIQNYKIEGEVVSSVSSATARIRRVDLPKMPKIEIREALKWEFQRTNFLSNMLNMDDLCLDYIILNESESAQENKMKLLVVVASKKDILEHIDILQSVGLKPIAVEIDCLAAATALDYIYQFTSQEIIVFLDFGAKTNSFNIIANKEMVFSRNLYSGENLLYSAIREGVLNLQKLREKKHEDGVFQTVLSGLDNLILDIEHSFDYFSHELLHSELAKFDKIFLCGGTTNLGDLASFLQNRLNSEVEISNPFKGIEISDEISQEIDNLEQLAPRFTAAFGLALRGVE